MAVAVFRDDDAGYRAWRAAHARSGFVLSLAGRRVGRAPRLHRAACWHLDPAEGRAATANPKACAADAAELAAWARREGWALRGPCPDCRPPLA